ncbi:MAG: hypothetical protein A2Z99_01010 [Treponema sp. GWB1_62_6]|nr:MAG: hypothetical protein A2Y36_16035 [Treponema sp. GWA1_62_8]OHE66028.1 MAG: hypothetical protein A2Z99_01010 [Treponema sp. GWB1_62_6]OHE68166.1 MAG: hypothetical protein A2001_12395 [Treponema sp. GWC1_61_84]OHE72557.1 MAG: hypothetical protein A2413_14665 [Treponema sp. RIFOXYC1_FULL_61_9]HCM28341.1 hypothetical protein [Treponema sp.]
MLAACQPRLFLAFTCIHAHNVCIRKFQILFPDPQLPSLRKIARKQDREELPLYHCAWETGMMGPLEKFWKDASFSGPLQSLWRDELMERLKNKGPVRSLHQHEVILLPIHIKNYIYNPSCIKPE